MEKAKVLFRFYVGSVLSLLLCSGCTVGNSVCYPVLGVGLVRVTESRTLLPTEGPEVKAAKIESLGMLLGTGPEISGLTVGYSVTQTTSVPAGVNATAETRSSTFGDQEVVVSAGKAANPPPDKFLRGATK